MWITLRTILAVVAAGFAASNKTAAEEADWTFFLYMNGDNNLQRAMLGNLRELEAVAAGDDVRFVVQIDDRSEARRLLVGEGVVEELGEINAGDGDSVADFVAWGVERYPAKNYGLVLSGHGQGWKYMAPDAQSRDRIGVADGEMGRALLSVNESLGKKVDLLAMEACYMGSWEVAHSVAPYADFLIVSQDKELPLGWPWVEAMTPLVVNSELEPRQAAEQISAGIAEGATRHSVTLIDLNEIPELSRSVDALALQALGVRRIVRDVVVDSHSIRPDDRDLGELLQLISEQVPELSDEADSAKAQLDRAILAHYSPDPRAAGLSIYTPLGRPGSGYAEGSWAVDTHWDELLTGGQARPRRGRLGGLGAARRPRGRSQ
jgi:hypothetical protein